ncbi:hypothetical protein CF327_g3679 [Tilletia walkeri]|uniref:Uncharacterized protein n=2 Tax=Tilletia TaxID=13289 RepID=A0A8X7N9A9_9BASI|nr:hypothetical protein CF327_g3679 [Tilletia walkeri]KAE8233108.1 hypothetical protein CF326_g1852 [Tilletia indica]KAE8258066.1 hypothetical protein A4X13_0g1930 [Tilletia indica]KAE8269626.1 hypothetical protein A4X09_0g2718 [Tilletia walkeri]
MWCDNCLLSHGAIAWNVFVAAYSLAGSIFLFRSGMFFFFNFPEYQIYGGIGMGVMAICVISIIGLSNNAYLWTRVCFFIWPIIIIASAVRASLMMFQLDRQQSKIIWECNNGGQLWGTSQEAGYTNSTSSATMPSGVCSAGFHSLYIAFVFSLLIDFGCQLYAYFMTWRFMKRIEHYQQLSMQEKFYY